jgi:hypothetical protein
MIGIWLNFEAMPPEPRNLATNPASASLATAPARGAGGDTGNRPFTILRECGGEIRPK